MSVTPAICGVWIGDNAPSICKRMSATSADCGVWARSNPADCLSPADCGVWSRVYRVARGPALSPVTLIAVTFQPSHINRPIAFCRVLGPVMPSPSASTTAHDPSQIFPKSFGKMPDTFAKAISGPLRGFPCLRPLRHTFPSGHCVRTPLAWVRRALGPSRR